MIVGHPLPLFRKYDLKSLRDSVSVSIHSKRISVYPLFRLQVSHFSVFVSARAIICAGKILQSLQLGKRQIYCPGGHLWDGKNPAARFIHPEGVPEFRRLVSWRQNS